MHDAELELLARQLADGLRGDHDASAAHWCGSLPAGIQSHESAWQARSR
jgi:hypothetical protein